MKFVERDFLTKEVFLRLFDLPLNKGETPINHFHRLMSIMYFQYDDIGE